MVFTGLGAVAELERSFIAERVRAGLRSARARGTKLGRPRANLDAARVSAIRAQGLTREKICKMTGLTRGTAQRSLLPPPKTRQ
jgi:DNA invertase Pin-like site-specific DNA recombinase